MEDLLSSSPHVSATNTSFSIFQVSDLHSVGEVPQLILEKGLTQADSLDFFENK